MSTIPQRLLTRAEAAEYLGLKPHTLTVWAMHGRGPKVVKLEGNAVRYRLADLEKYIQRSVASQHLTATGS